MSELDLGPINWESDPNIATIERMLLEHNYKVESLERQTMSRYVLQQPLGQNCFCSKHRITVHQNIIQQNCRCGVRVLGTSHGDMIYETTANSHHLRYSREKARPIRVPEGYKFIALRSDTGTGKNKQIDVLLQALLHGQFNRYHTEVDKTELSSVLQYLYGAKKQGSWRKQRHGQT